MIALVLLIILKVKTKQELKQVLETALIDGNLGPFGLNVIGQEQSAVKQEFGTPDALQEAKCTACDAANTVTYGDYNLGYVSFKS
ncbi:hypothetical protein ACT7C4_26625 [Bacillus pacificus]